MADINEFIEEDNIVDEVAVVGVVESSVDGWSGFGVGEEWVEEVGLVIGDEVAVCWVVTMIGIVYGAGGVCWFVAGEADGGDVASGRHVG